MKLKIKKLIPDLDLRYHSDGASGIDIPTQNDMTFIKGSGPLLMGAGFCVEIPHGYEGQIRSRSSSRKKGIEIAPGTIDSDYRGEVHLFVDYSGVFWDPNGSKTFTIKKGERIAQLVICPVQKCDIEFVDELSETKRGNGGFGSTGK